MSRAGAEPKIVALNATSFLVLNVSEYTMIKCKHLHEIKKGCMACVSQLEQSCGYVLYYHSTIIFPKYKNGESTVTKTQVKYPRNLMVANLLLSKKDLAKFKVDTLDGSEPELELPLDSALSKEIASDKKGSLDLEKVMTNLKADEISYKRIADKILHQHIDSISPSVVSSSNVSYVPWINLALNILHFIGFLYLFWKSKVFASAMAMTWAQV